IRKSEPLHLTDVHETIERLYATGNYEDIQVEAQRSGDGVLVRILTKNSWFIGNVSVGGHVSDPPNRGQLVNVTQLNLGQPFTESDVPPAQNEIKRLFDANGLYGARIRPEVIYEPDTQQVSI